MERVPPELWTRILGYLPPPALLQTATLSLKFSQISLPLLLRLPHLHSSAQLHQFLHHLHHLLEQDPASLAQIKEIRISLPHLENVTEPLLEAIHLLEDSGAPPLQFLSLSAVRGLDLTVLPSTIQSIDIDSNLYPLSQLDSLPPPALAHIQRLTIRSHYLVAIQACLRDWYATLLRSFTGLVGLKVVGLELRSYLNPPKSDEITTWLTTQTAGSTSATTLDTIQNLAWYDSDDVLFQAFLSTLPNLKSLQTTAVCNHESLLRIISPSFHTLKLFRTAHQPPRSLKVLEQDSNTIVSSFQQLQAQGRCNPKRLCIDYEWWPVRDRVTSKLEEMGVKVIWGVYSTEATEEWLPEWGDRIPDLS